MEAQQIIGQLADPSVASRVQPPRTLEPEARITVDYVVSHGDDGYHATAFIRGPQPRKVGPVIGYSGEEALSRLEPELNQRVQERWPIGFTPES